MPNSLYRKGLVVVLIMLFFSNGVQPAISNEVLIPEISDEEDCVCNVLNARIHLVEKIIKKLEKNEDLQNVIKSNNPQEWRPICDLLNYMFWKCSVKGEYWWNKANEYYKGTFWYNIYLYISAIYAAMMYYYGVIYILLDCYDFPYYP